MKLEKIEIKNFKSIEKIEISINPIGGNKTYCLFGINESGKSSILKGISLFDSEEIKYPDDYFDESEPVEILFYYKIEKFDLEDLHKKLIKEYKCPKAIVSNIEPSSVILTACFDEDLETKKYNHEEIKFKNSSLKDYYFDGTNILKIDPSLEEEDPEEISVPLYNCFRLAGVKPSRIADKIQNLTSPARIRNLESLLSRKVTKHIKDVWPDHPISLLFEIDSSKITLLVEDDNVSDKAKTTSQRSDGFKQFISFLLTISADGKNQSLTNKVLLIDEPETHLHPQAQINLKEELIKITSSKDTTIVIYATHSNYLIDKSHLNRNFKVAKVDNEKTTINQIIKISSTYSEVNFEVFDIPTTDYHNELYGYLEENNPEELNGLEQIKDWINERTNNTERVSLPKFIRHSIHHPENSSNRKYSESQLRKSIKLLRAIKYG